MDGVHQASTPATPRPTSKTASRRRRYTDAAALPGVFGGQRLESGGLYVAQPGDTLWALARALQPVGDLDVLVDELVELNGGPELDVGERVRLPG
jgi:Tfp pilus assembly protein FimV